MRKIEASENNTKLHSLLRRQLSRLEVDEKSPPDAEIWQELLEKINKTYIEADLERSLIERSMQLSSNELMNLNQRLESAQETAQLGYWEYNLEKETLSVSKFLYEKLFNDEGESIVSLDSFLNLLSTKSQKEISAYLTERKAFECELKLKTPINGILDLEIIGNLKNGKYLTGIIRNITKEKETDEKIRKLNEELIQSAREVGKTDVVNSVLHNVGNILNSANISINLIAENINEPHFTRLFSIGKELKQHENDLMDYLQNDTRGKLIPKYLVSLIELLENKYLHCYKEIENLEKQVSFIKEIVSAQQMIGSNAGLYQETNLSELVDAAIKMTSTELNNITIQREPTDLPPITTDRSKVIQIVVNLLLNAKQSLIQDTENINKKIIIEKSLSDDKNYVMLGIEDNGLGIEPNNLEKIFSFGFTTKKEGHGFGLHSSFLSAKEIGAELSFQSNGPGEGATFLLKIPIKPKKKE